MKNKIILDINDKNNDLILKLARDPNTDKKILELFSYLSNNEILNEVVKNKNTRKKNILRIIKENIYTYNEVEVMKCILKNKKLSKRILRKIINCRRGEGEYIKIIVSNSNTPKKILRKIYKNGTCDIYIKKIIQNPNVSKRLLKKIYKKGNNNNVKMLAFITLKKLNVEFKKEETVYIPDNNLRKELMSILKASTSEEITKQELSKLTGHLSLTGAKIKNITGLEYCINVKDLWLNYNEIEDVSILENLTNLKELRLFRNKIKNITPITRLTNLEVLDLKNNPIEDFTPIKELEKNGCIVYGIKVN